MDKSKNSASVLVGLVALFLFLCYSLVLSAKAEYKAEMKASFEVNETRIIQIKEAKTQLNAVADIFRTEELSDEKLVNQLSEKWLEIDDIQKNIEKENEDILNKLKIKRDFETDLLARLIVAEAGYYNEEDMFMVGNVVMNRVESDKFPNTIEEVIYQKSQYSSTWNGAINNEPNELALDIAERLLDGERIAPKDVLFQATFVQGDIWKKIGAHKYCYG